MVSGREVSRPDGFYLFPEFSHNLVNDARSPILHQELAAAAAAADDDDVTVSFVMNARVGK